MQQRSPHLKCSRPVPFALCRSDTQLKAAVGVIPVEGSLHSRSQLPHQSGVALAPLQRLVAVVKQHIPGGDGDDLQSNTWVNDSADPEIH